MASISTIDNNNDKIEKLWVMGGASVMKDRNTREIVGYLCYCEECKKKSVSGDGGIAFYTAEDLLAHRKMNAFECPCGCGFHICEEFGSIIRHLDAYHKEVLAKLEKEGLDLTTKKRVWIYHDYANNTYTLTEPMPIAASPLENAGAILAMTPPKRVAVPPSPVPSSVSNSPVPFDKTTSRKTNGKKKFIPLDKHNENKVSSYVGPAKTWVKPESIRANVSLSQVMAEQASASSTNVTANTESVKPVHYAQQDMRKEKQCQYGKGCVKRDRPFACALNHDGNGDIIKCGTELTDDILCPFERPPFQRCGDGRCTKVHLENRAEFIEQKKKQFFSSEQKDKNEKMSYSSVTSALKNVGNNTATAVITTSSEGTTIMMSREDAMAVAAALQELEQEEAVEMDGPRTVFPADTSSSSSSDEEDEEEEDLTDIATFAARFNRLTVSN